MDNQIIEKDMEKVNRRLELYGEITPETSSKLISELRAIIDEDVKILKSNVKIADEYKQRLEPVEIYFHSPGGSVLDGCAILSIMEEVEAPIYGHIIGDCSSMATYIFLACDIRTGTRFCQAGLHGVGFTGYGLTGYAKEIESINQGAKRLGKILDEEILLERTKMTRKELEKTQTCLRFLGYKELLEYGFFTDDIYNIDLELNSIDD